MCSRTRSVYVRDNPITRRNGDIHSHEYVYILRQGRPHSMRLISSAGGWTVTLTKE